MKVNLLSKGWLIAAIGIPLVATGIWLMVFRSDPVPEATSAKPLQPIVLTGQRQDLESYLRPDVAAALGFDPNVPKDKRLELLRALRGSDLSASECEALLLALVEPPGPAWTGGSFTEYFHETASVLQRQKQVRERFARLLATVASDPQRNETLRDYSMQHLTRVLSSAIDDPELRKAIVATCKKLVSADAVIASSALLSLHLLETGGSPDGKGDSGYLVPDGDMVPLVARLLKADPTVENLDSRMAAIRISGDRRFNEHLPLIRKIAGDSMEHVLVRMAAVHVISRFGEASDRRFLESIDRNDFRLSGAVDQALAKFP